LASTDAEIAADNAAIEEYRAKFGDDRAAQFAADLYKLRRTPAPAGMFSGMPRSIIILIAIWVGLLETADKLPRLLLAFPGYEATLAEYQAKMMQPDITAAQLEKAKNEAKASAYQPDLTAVQLDKTKLETRAAAFQPGTAEAQLEKSKQEAKASAWQSLATAAQGLETEGRFMSNGNLSSTYTDRMSRTLGSLKPDDPWEPSVHLPSLDLPKKTEALQPPDTPAPAPPKVAPAPQPDTPAAAPPKAVAEATPPPASQPTLNAAQYQAAMNYAAQGGNYARAFKIAQEAEAKAEADETKAIGAPGEKTRAALVGVGWYGLFARQFKASLDASERAISLKSGELVPVTNRAHALMLLGRADDAKAVYLSHKGEKVLGVLWEKAISGDFDALRKAGITNPLMDEIEAAFK